MRLEEAKKEFKSLNAFLAEQPSDSPSIIDLHWLDKADKVATTSNHFKYQVGTIIYRRSKIVSFAANEKKTHPYKMKNHPHCNNNAHAFCNLHAEISAIISALRKGYDLSCSSIAVSRISKGVQCCSYPCNMCWPVLERVGIKHVVCYDYNGQPISIKL